jgi:uncharacterized protein (DUF952 family)
MRFRGFFGYTHFSNSIYLPRTATELSNSALGLRKVKAVLLNEGLRIEQKNGGFKTFDEVITDFKTLFPTIYTNVSVTKEVTVANVTSSKRLLNMLIKENS